MSRTLSPCMSFPVTGSTITLSFPDIAKPTPGGWTIELSLRKTNPDDENADIAVMQAGRLVASQHVTLTTSFTDVTLNVSAEDLNDVTTGLCHISSVVVTITGSSTTPCCGIVPALTATGTGDSIAMDYTIPFYNARGVFFGDPCTVQLLCTAGVWAFSVSHEPGSPCFPNEEVYHCSAFSCDPIEIHFSNVDFCGVVTDLVVTE